MRLVPIRQYDSATYERLLANTSIDTNGCMLWQGSVDKTGYGKTRVYGQIVFVHRYIAFYQLTDEERSILEDTHLALHVCDKPACINPAHLYIGTHSDNNLDAYTSGHRKRVETGNSRLTIEDVIMIRHLHNDGHTYASISREFGTTKENISLICRGITWQSV